MESKEFDIFTLNVIKQFDSATEAMVESIKQWVGESIMDLHPNQTEQCMRMIKLLERMRDQVQHIRTGQDVEGSSWKVRILTAIRDCGGKATTQRLRAWMEEHISFSDYDRQTIRYNNESVLRWWHSLRPNLTHMVQDGTIERAKHGTYTITPLGEEYLDS